MVEDEKGTNKRKERKQNFSKNSKKRKFDSKDKDSKKKKGPCYNCGKMGHIKKECRLLKKQKKDGNPNFVAMICEVLVVENENEWWIDSVPLGMHARIEAYSPLMNLLRMAKPST